MLEGYGQTECGAICCLQMPGDGTIGRYILLGIRRVGSDRVWSYLSTDALGWDHW